LRERRAEVVPLAESFLRQLCEREGRRAPELDEEAVALLLAHTWPGNVRELVNTIEHALIMCDGRRIRGGDLPESLTSGSTPESAPGDGSVKERLERIERASIVKALADCGQNQTHAAVRLGLSRRALIYKMGKYGLGRGNG
jgi:DNA-binding NtrC family response regulator